jgi:hypothetical protein
MNLSVQRSNRSGSDLIAADLARGDAIEQHLYNVAALKLDLPTSPMESARGRKPG